ncbi:large conductance mechanosensitive channel protein MscL [Ihubacter sp. mB4P-1]|uniref:large conductance mechanosensitive channel protein MscL n=1 Tax=Ihubacter sp. mB4P-1 TaxID=3242370 RepID=UPI003C7D8805
MKKFLSEFKEFIARGDVMSMAIGIIIGSAFTAIVNSLVGDIITPILGIVIGGLDFTNIVITVGSAKIMVGNFIQAIIVFLLTALVIFSMMKVFNNFMKKKEDKPSEAEPETPADIALLTEIRDLLKSKNN